MSKGSSGPEETAAEKALAEVMASRFQRFQSVYAPIENEFMRDTFMLRSPGEYNEAAGQAGAAVEQSFAPAEQEFAREQMSAGVDPSSGRFVEGSRALRRAKTRALGTAMSDAQIGQTDRFYGGLQDIVAIGQGQSAQAGRGMGDVAARANEYASRSAQDALSRSLGVQEVVGAATGAGFGVGMNRDTED